MVVKGSRQAEDSIRTSARADSGQVYYVDSAAGNDSHEGTSSNRPWRTLERLNKAKFAPGDTIRFRRDRTFPGTFAPQGSGTAQRPIVATSYGVGKKPVFDGQGATAAILLKNVAGWELEHLEVTNSGPKITDGGQRAGILVLLEDFGVGKHYVVSDVYVHDVNGTDVYEPIPGGGIIFVAGGVATPTGFDRITVRGCTISHVDRQGICTQSHWSMRAENPNGRGTQHVPMTNIVLRDNLLQDIGGDGIMINNGLGALVEHNVLDGFADRVASGTAVGIYGFNSDNGVFRHNRVSNGKKNAMAFDIETGNLGTLYEYNHSYRNNGGFLLTCNDPNSTSDDAVIRYNVSWDDRDGDGDWPTGVLTLACGVTTNLRIHHNTFYSPRATRLVNNSDLTAAEVTNNIFVGRADGSVIIDSHGTYRNNLYHNVVLQQAVDQEAVEADPMLVIGEDGFPVDESRFGEVRAGSPVLNAGAASSPNIGAYQEDGADPDVAATRR